MSQDKKVTVTISGPPNTAKSFMAAKISAALTLFGQGEITIVDEIEQAAFQEDTRQYFLNCMQHKSSVTFGYTLPAPDALRDHKNFARVQPVDIVVQHVGRKLFHKQKIKDTLGKLQIIGTAENRELFYEICKQIDEL